MWKKNKASPLFIASWKGHESTVQLLLSNGAYNNIINVTKIVEVDMLRGTVLLNMQTLIYARKMNFLTLLNYGADID